jgi:hypothetical protein
MDEARNQLNKLADWGIDLAATAFGKSFDKARASIERKLREGKMGTMAGTLC